MEGIQLQKLEDLRGNRTLTATTHVICVFLLTDACMFQFTVTVNVLTGWKLGKCNFEAKVRETK